MLLAGNPEQPGHAVRRAEVVPVALALDAGHVDPALRQPPQGRRAETPQADYDHVLANDLHRRRVRASTKAPRLRRQRRPNSSAALASNTPVQSPRAGSGSGTLRRPHSSATPPAAAGGKQSRPGRALPAGPLLLPRT